MLEIELVGGQVLRPSGLDRGSVSLGGGRISEGRAPKQVDISGFSVFPGLVDVHGDGFERHVAPRRGAMKDVTSGLLAAEKEMAANGITTGVLAQFMSWEGGLRGEAFAEQVFTAMASLDTVTDLIPQLRFETHLLENFAGLPDQIAAWGIPYVVFNDHLPHDRLQSGQTPRRLVSQALKAARSPEKHHNMMKALEARSAEVPAALDTLCAELATRGVRMGSHDDRTAGGRSVWAGRGVEVAEFPETLEAAETDSLVVLGSPNVVRGGSHNGNLSALDAIMMGHCDALASDYHYPSMLRAALFLGQTIGLPDAWKLVSEGPARVLGLTDRGRIAPGLRADLVILDDHNRIAGTIAGGRVSFLRAELAERLINPA